MPATVASKLRGESGVYYDIHYGRRMWKLGDNHTAKKEYSEYHQKNDSFRKRKAWCEKIPEVSKWIKSNCGRQRGNNGNTLSAEIKAIATSTQDSVKALAEATKESFEKTHQGMHTMCGALEATMKKVKDLESAKADVGAAKAADNENVTTREKESQVSFDETANSGAITHQLSNLRNLKSALKKNS